MIREIHNVFFIYKYSTLIVVVVYLFIMTCAYTFSDDVSTLISINLSPGLRAFTPLKNIIDEKREREKYNIYVCYVYLNFPHILFL